MRPVSLAEVVEIAGRDEPHFAMACNEFCDGFYLQYPDSAAMQGRIDPEPKITGHVAHDAWIGAIGEHLALRWGLNVPPWTKRPAHFALRKPLFMSPSPALQSFLLAESPPAFRARLIFTGSEP